MSRSRMWMCIRHRLWWTCCAGMRDAGKTVFVITHQAALLEGVADEFVWMQAGQIVDRTASLARARRPRMSMNSLWSVTLPRWGKISGWSGVRKMR